MANMHQSSSSKIIGITMQLKKEDQESSRAAAPSNHQIVSLRLQWSPKVLLTRSNLHIFFNKRLLQGDIELMTSSSQENPPASRFYLKRAVQRPMTSPWHTNSALNSLPSRVRSAKLVTFLEQLSLLVVNLQISK